MSPTEDISKRFLRAFPIIYYIYSERKQPKHVGDGLVMGFQGLGIGIIDGMTGIIRKPIEGTLLVLSLV